MTTLFARIENMGALVAIPKDFSTGSKGFYGQTKLGAVTAPDILGLTVTDADDNVVALGHLVYRQFKTGSWGYYCNGKATIDGKPHTLAVSLVAIKGTDPRATRFARYQSSLTAVEIGSKPVVAAP